MSRFTAVTTPSVKASATTSTIPSTITEFSTSWNCTLTGSSTWLSTAKLSRNMVEVTVIKPVRDVCVRGYICGEVKLKDDITGIGVIVAFFVTAWAAFIFLITAYWLGLLPDQLIRPVDRQLFRANSRRCHSEWKQTLDKVTLLFSDQQLLTGIAIMLAGYYEVFAHDLDALHWHTVTYLAWISSTVHLITLSLLKDRLNANKTMRNFRLAAMLTLLSLLIVALAPTASLFYVDVASILPGKKGGFTYTMCEMSKSACAAIPAKCFYGSGYTADWRPYQGISPFESIGSQVAPAAIISYTTLVGSYVWKISQLLESSLNWWRTTIRYMPEAKLELVAKRALTKHQRPTWYDMCFYYVTKSAYIVFCMVSDVLESFATTNVILFFALSWGTLQVALPRIWLKDNTDNSSEGLSFGQILPLMLLLQPVAGIVTHFIGKSGQATNIRHPSASYQSLLPFRPSAYSTLADAFRNSQLLTAKEKALGHYDPMKQHLLESKTYQGLLWSFLIVSYCLVIVLETLALLIGLTFGADIFVLVLWMTCCCWLAWIPFSVMFYSLFSTKLR